MAWMRASSIASKAVGAGSADRLHGRTRTLSILTVIAAGLITSFAGFAANLATELSRGTTIVAIAAVATGLVSVLMAILAIRTLQVAGAARMQSSLMRDVLAKIDVDSNQSESPDELVPMLELTPFLEDGRFLRAIFVGEWAAFERDARRLVAKRVGDDMIGLPLTRLLRTYSDLLAVPADEREELRHLLNIRNELVHGMYDSQPSDKVLAASLRMLRSMRTRSRDALTTLPQGQEADSGEGASS